MRALVCFQYRTRLAKVAVLLIVACLCLSCASLIPSSNRPTSEPATILDIQHSHSGKPSDCLAVCVGMVLDYYGVRTTIPDTTLPLELLSLTKHLNTGSPVDSEGHMLFATVLELTPKELLLQLAQKRPVILVSKLSERRTEYHSVVLSGYSAELQRFYVNDPARRKPSWRKLSDYSTFMDSGKYLTLLIGLREK